MNSYLLEVPQELYHIIVSYLPFDETLIMHNFRKPSYKTLFRLNYLDLYKLYENIKQKDYTLNRYSIKDMYYYILSTPDYDYIKNRRFFELICLNHRFKQNH